VRVTYRGPRLTARRYRSDAITHGVIENVAEWSATKGLDAGGGGGLRRQD
jgi:hypothetical protein